MGGKRKDCFEDLEEERKKISIIGMISRHLAVEVPDLMMNQVKEEGAFLQFLDRNWCAYLLRIWTAKEGLDIECKMLFIIFKLNLMQEQQQKREDGSIILS